MKSILTQPLLRVRRSSSMARFSFGEWVTEKNYKGNDCIASTLNLHLQCPWRVIDKKTAKSCLRLMICMCQIHR